MFTTSECQNWANFQSQSAIVSYQKPLYHRLSVTIRHAISIASFHHSTMSSEALSEQSCVHEGAGYDEVYSSGQDDPNTSYDERVSFANSPSMEEDEDLDVDRS
ncbi:hypothetical protein SO802_023101 [Lithocarpus litseifolius]|uniref:Uncharacterized protein n=1 Tax=Lithocarpus litseifolius TaxID=425828 RepID=A0AAW2C625_9ROSI